MLRMASTRASTSHSWEAPQQVRPYANKPEGGDTSPCSSSLTGSPPLSSPGADRALNIPIPERDRSTHTSSCHSQTNVSPMAGNGSLRRPELTFSIERILGLGCSSNHSMTMSSQPIITPSVPDRIFSSVITGNISVAAAAAAAAVGHGRNMNYIRHRDGNADDNGDDDDDDDDVDDEDDDDEGEDNESVIDVGGPGEVVQFMSRTGHEYPGELACLNKEGVPNYQWLHCTRYHPPKLQRSKKAAGTKKRKLGRNPRVPFTQHQVMVLEEKFRRTHYLSSMDVAELSTALSLTETRVKIWFQNRRARERRDKEAQQRNQHSGVPPKPFQPLTIPTVTWSVPSQPMSSSNFVQFPGNSGPQDFSASAFLSSPFSMFAGQAPGLSKPAVDLSRFSSMKSPRGLVFVDNSSHGRPSVGDASSDESS